MLDSLQATTSTLPAFCAALRTICMRCPHRYCVQCDSFCDLFCAHHWLAFSIAEVWRRLSLRRRGIWRRLCKPLGVCIFVQRGGSNISSSFFLYAGPGLDPHQQAAFRFVRSGNVVVAGLLQLTVCGQASASSKRPLLEAAT